MSNIGTIIQIYNLIIVLGWPVFSLLTLYALRRRQLNQTAQVMWAVLILVVPFMGPLAFWIVRPGEVGAGAARN